jgi:hypothetical protein
VATAYSELIRRVYIGFPRTDGEANLSIKQSINDAIQAISCLEEASSLLTTDLTSASTVDGIKSYHKTTGTYNLGLTRPKDIYSIRLEDTTSSRKLIYVPYSELDQTIPYPEGTSEGKSNWYTEFGDYIEFIPIPDAAYNLYIRYSQYPVALSADTDQSPFGIEWDHIIVFLSKDIANAYLNGEYINAALKANEYLKLGISEKRNKPDHRLIAQPFNPLGSGYIGEYYKDPFIKGVR